jgi:serine protease Do
MKKSWLSILIIAIIGLGLTVAVSASANKLAASSKAEIHQETSAPSEAASKNPSDFRNIIVDIAKKSIPSVVHIEVTETQEVQSPFIPFGNDPFFRHFFDFPQMPKKFKREMKGIGSGIIINDKGYILTNNHVVNGAKLIQVSLSDGSQYQAKLIGTDWKTDLAVIKISAKDKLPCVTFGDSDQVQVGEWVVAIGQPRGLDESVTQGIISAKHRQGITDPSTYQDFLQTDAAINPGNSGGPLIDLDGHVIGINSVIASQSGGSEGIGFAIPSNIAVHIARSLMETGKVERGWLGITLQDISFDKMKSLKLGSSKGAYVVDVVKGGPADKAGIKKDDVILSYEGKGITDSGDLRNLVAGTGIGKEVKLGVLRDGRKLSIALKVGNLDEAAKMMASTVRDKLGADVRPVSKTESDKYGLDQTQGVAIRRLDANGPLARAGFEVDDIILQIDNQPINGIDTFTSMVSLLKPNQKIAILVLDHRSGQTGSINVEVNNP